MTKTSRSQFLKRGPDDLRWLAPMFDELKHVIDGYIDWHDDPAKNDIGEPPYWNNETASVSMLIAAAARTGYITLADYRTERKGGSKGRCDLYLAKKNDWLEIEAKQITIRERGPASSIEKALACGIAQTKTLPTKEPCAALVFAIMSIPATDQGLNWTATEFKKLFKEVDADLCWLWYDTDVDERYGWENDDRVWPGLGIFLRKR
jgi:hypothetical protein